MTLYNCPECHRWSTVRGTCLDCLNGKTRLQRAYELIEQERKDSEPDRAEAGVAQMLRTDAITEPSFDASQSDRMDLCRTCGHAKQLHYHPEPHACGICFEDEDDICTCGSFVPGRVERAVAAKSGTDVQPNDLITITISREDRKVLASDYPGFAELARTLERVRRSIRAALEGEK